MRFTGSCAISGTLSVTSGLEIGGLYQSSSLNESNAASDIIDIDTASQVYIHDFTLGYSGFASSGTQAINVTAPASSENTQSLFEHLMIGGGSYIGINFVAASNWNINASHIDSQNVAVIVANTNNADSGDSTIYGSTLVGLGVSAGGGATAALEWNSSGGLRFSNNKINGITMTNGILIDLASGVTTSDILISNNSIEGVATNSVLMERQGSTGALSNVDIVGNQFVTNTNGINIPTDANGVWLTEVLIQGNTFALGLANPQVAFEVDTVQNINITSNAVLANGGGSNYAYKIGSTGPSSSNCVIGIVSKRGSFQASTGTSNCTVVGPD